MVKVFQFASPINKLILEDAELRRELEKHHNKFLLGVSETTSYPNESHRMFYIFERNSHFERNGEIIPCYRFF